VTVFAYTYKKINDPLGGDNFDPMAIILTNKVEVY
jgi:hypothetical protein